MATEGFFIKTANLFITPQFDSDKHKGVWSAPWLIELREGKEKKGVIGKAEFGGIPVKGDVSLSLAIDDKYKNNGYATEVLKSLVEFAFMQKDVYEIHADVDTENDAAVKVLNRLGFVFRTGDRKTEHYSIIKPPTVWAGVYLVIGIVTGLALGIVFANVLVGFLAGIIIAIFSGAVLDTKAKEHRERVTGKKMTRD